MITEIINHTQIIIPIVGIAVVVIIGAIVWAGIAIYKFIDREYVEKIECEKCRTALKEECRDDINDCYKTLEKKIDDMQEKFAKDVKEIDQKLDQWITTGVRIETKMDLLMKSFLTGDNNGFKL